MKNSLGDLVGTVLSEKQIVAQSYLRSEALLRKNSDTRPRLQMRFPLLLDTASTASNPLHIPDPFTSYYVESASDGSTYVQLCLTSPEDSNVNNYTQLGNKDSAIAKEPIKGCYLLWPAQAGKKLTLVLYLDVEFKPGSFLLALTGGVIIGTGTLMSPNAVVSCANTVGPATKLFANATTNKKVWVTNLDPGLFIWLSGLNTVVSGQGALVGSLVGVPVGPGASIEWTNTGDIYGVSDNAAGSLVAINVEA